MVRKRFHQFIAVLLSAAIPWTGGEGAYAAIFKTGSPLTGSALHFATQALTLPGTTAHTARKPFISVLLAGFILTLVASNPGHAQVQTGVNHAQSDDKTPAEADSAPLTDTGNLPTTLLESRKKLNGLLDNLVAKKDPSVSAGIEELPGESVKSLPRAQRELLAERLYSLFLVQPEALPPDIRAAFEELQKLAEQLNAALKKWDALVPLTWDAKNPASRTYNKSYFQKTTRKEYKAVDKLRLKMRAVIEKVVPKIIEPGKDWTEGLNSNFWMNSKDFASRNAKAANPNATMPSVKWSVSLVMRRVRVQDPNADPAAKPMVSYRYEILETVIREPNKERHSVHMESAPSGPHQGLRVIHHVPGTSGIDPDFPLNPSPTGPTPSPPSLGNRPLFDSLFHSGSLLLLLGMSIHQYKPKNRGRRKFVSKEFSPEELAALNHERKFTGLLSSDVQLILAARERGLFQSIQHFYQELAETERSLWNQPPRPIEAYHQLVRQFRKYRPSVFGRRVPKTPIVVPQAASPDDPDVYEKPPRKKILPKREKKSWRTFGGVIIATGLTAMGWNSEAAHHHGEQKLKRAA